MAGTDIIKPADYRALSVPDDAFQHAVQQLSEQEVGEFDLTRIKIPAGGGQVWSIPSVRGADDQRVLQGVIVFVKGSRAYWPHPFEGGNEPPVCSSLDGKIARQVSEVDPKDPAKPIKIPAERNAAGGLICDTCSYAEFGSGDGRRQACKQMRQIFLILPNRLLPAVLTLPPTSLRNARQYLLGLVDEGVRQHGVITNISLEKKKNEGTPEFSVATFTLGEPLSAEQTARAEAYANAARPHFMRVQATADDLPTEETTAPQPEPATAG